MYTLTVYKLFRRKISEYMEPTKQQTVVQGSEGALVRAAKFDVRLTDTFDSTVDVVEWHTQASLRSEYRDVPLVDVLPMWMK